MLVAAKESAYFCNSINGIPNENWSKKSNYSEDTH